MQLLVGSGRRLVANVLHGEARGVVKGALELGQGNNRVRREGERLDDALEGLGVVVVTRDPRRYTCKYLRITVRSGPN